MSSVIINEERDKKSFKFLSHYHFAKSQSMVRVWIRVKMLKFWSGGPKDALVHNMPPIWDSGHEWLIRNSATLHNPTWRSISLRTWKVAWNRLAWRSECNEERSWRESASGGSTNHETTNIKRPALHATKWMINEWMNELNERVYFAHLRLRR